MLMNNVNKKSQDVENKYENLYQVLVQEVSTYNKLSELMLKKQKSIISGDITALQDLTAKEQSVVREANAFSNTRHFLLKEILVKLGRNSSNASLSHLLELTGHSRDNQWLLIKDRLYETVDKIRKINFENQELLKTSLTFVKEMVKVFFPADNTFNNTYSEDGKVRNQNKIKKVLDCQI